ncbi:hypothetical protein MJC1_02777 [Methylocystis sp. MJC1]|uniref:GvpL/GvpF family gas vesicle protein n=1 Tax=Methylocystis sp. MJC1 TaxID=2654282 RepID=UPI00210FC8BD|nr:GvpL/GvpF family gas vesicle protein [Methylocystis sp. MJC1]KAF2990117.1 hypothetical protein MJC1_02777 [Methylocystis sp. MJC1]
MRTPDPPETNKAILSIGSSESAISLFAFVDANQICAGQLMDSEESALTLHRAGVVGAIIDSVPIADFCGVDSQRNLQDVSWLARRVRRHAEILARAMQFSPVFPVPFGTLYTSLESLSAFMESHEATIARFLLDASDKEEWELRAAARLDDPIVLDRLARKAWPEWAKLSNGLRYMRLCRDKHMLRDLGRAEAAVVARNLVQELEPLSAGSCDRNLEGTDLIARHAFLVPKGNAAALSQRVAELNGRLGAESVEFTLSGPWPPYSFRPQLNRPLCSSN